MWEIATWKAVGAGHLGRLSWPHCHFCKVFPGPWIVSTSVTHLHTERLGEMKTRINPPYVRNTQPCETAAENSLFFGSQMLTPSPPPAMDVRVEPLLVRKPFPTGFRSQTGSWALRALRDDCPFPGGVGHQPALRTFNDNLKVNCHRRPALNKAVQAVMSSR